MGFGTTTVKYLLFFFNFIFALSGLAFLAYGLIIRYYSSKTDNLANQAAGDSAGLVALALIIIGSAVFVISFFGCCGAIRESHCMVTVYAMFLLTLFLVELAIVVYLYINQGKLEEITRSSMTSIFNSYSTKNESKAFVDEMQADFHCCGVDSPSDWTTQGIPALPHSCCREDGGQGTTCSKTQAWQDGCMSKTIEVAKREGSKLFKFVLGIAGGELVGIIFALCLASSIKNEERRQGYA
ncbi:CD63 antigen-like [Adelges cooleyi]|uniref:CD63 antigen-like n=1 Tax=Adelges cooleyi TaxID=133065 RepID=UPI00217FD1E8|nr:CD63 antigen-like [Adelges cooleyi]